MEKIKIGFIGQGWIGKNYADNFEQRGYEIVRYDIEKFKDNKDKLKDCRIVLVAVPTPTNKNGFDDSILINAIETATSPDQTVVIKSTIKLGTTDKIQAMFPDRCLIHSPEFLTEKTAAYDAANPDRNILGYTEKSFSRCGEVMNVLPCAPHEAIVPCREAELVKYMGNCWFYAKVLMMNAFYDIASHNNLDFDCLKDMLAADKRVGRTHLEVVHQGGRGAGGHCFIKDFAALREMYEELAKVSPDNNRLSDGLKMLAQMEKFNFDLLKETGKSVDLLEGVYGTDNK
jgi:nucleotide sugar dehydrogenase